MTKKHECLDVLTWLCTCVFITNNILLVHAIHVGNSEFWFIVIHPSEWG